MGPEEIAFALGLLNLLRIMGPKIAEAVKSGQVPVEKQKEIRAAYDSLTTDMDAHFTGPEWEIEPDDAPIVEVPPKAPPA